MSALIRKTLYFLTLLAATVFILNYIPAFAQQDPGSIKLKDFYPPTAIPSPTRTPTGQYKATVTPTPSSSSQSPQPPTPSPDKDKDKDKDKDDDEDDGDSENGDFIHFSQLDSRWINYNPDTDGKIGSCGCGETSIAMILATFFDKSSNPDNGDYNPREMWDAMERLYPGRCGTNFTNHRTLLNDFDVNVSDVNYYFSDTPEDIKDSNRVIKNYLNDGYKIILFFKWKDKAFGHFVVVVDVKGDTLYVHDPLKSSDSAAPVASNVNIVSFIAVKKD